MQKIGLLIINKMCKLLVLKNNGVGKMKEQIMEVIESINNPKILKLVYAYVKAAKKKAEEEKA